MSAPAWRVTAPLSSNAQTMNRSGRRPVVAAVIQSDAFIPLKPRRPTRSTPHVVRRIARRARPTPPRRVREKCSSRRRLGRGERGLEAIDMHIVREYAHPELGTAVRGVAKSCLDAHGQKRDRHLTLRRNGEPLNVLGHSVYPRRAVAKSATRTGCR